MSTVPKRNTEDRQFHHKNANRILDSTHPTFTHLFQWNPTETHGNYANLQSVGFREF